MRWTSTPITPEPSPWRPKAAIAEPGEVAHLAVVAGPQRLADALAQRVEVEPLAALEALLGQSPLDRLALDGAEEEAVEQHVEHVAVLLGLGERRGERLAEVDLRRSS